MGTQIPAPKEVNYGAQKRISNSTMIFFIQAHVSSFCLFLDKKTYFIHIILRDERRVVSKDFIQ